LLCKQCENYKNKQILCTRNILVQRLNGYNHFVNFYPSITIKIHKEYAELTVELQPIPDFIKQPPKEENEEYAEPDKNSK